MATGSSVPDVVSIARDLIRFDTTNYGEGRSNGEQEAAEYVEALLQRSGLQPAIHCSAPGRANVVARVPGRDRSLPALVLHGHLDVVPADPSMWTVDPFAGEIADGMLWGRGAVDMKNMDAMIIASVGEILDAGELPARDVVVAFFADEEAGGRFGAGWMVREHPELFAGATEAVSEVGGYSIEVAGERAYLLQTGEKGMLWIRLVAQGHTAHGSRFISDNAVTKVARAVTKLGELQWPVTLTDTTSRLLAEIARVSGADISRLSPDEVILRTGNAAGFLQATIRNTSNPTVLSAGYKHNVIPGRAEALIDIRTLPGEQEQVLAHIREVLAGDEVEIEIVETGIGLELPFDGEPKDTIARILQRHDPGCHVFPYLMSGGTDNKALAALGIKGYGFAPLRLPPTLDFPSMFHGIDERVPLDSLVFGQAVLRDFLSEYAGTLPPG